MHTQAKRQCHELGYQTQEKVFKEDDEVNNALKQCRSTNS